MRMLMRIYLMRDYIPSYMIAKASGLPGPTVRFENQCWSDITASTQCATVLVLQVKAAKDA